MNIGVIFAGGVGSRMNTKDKPKQFLEIHNRPIIIRTLDHFEKNEDIDCVVVACVKEWIPYLEDLIEKYSIKKVKKIVPGGATGQLSIYNGLIAAKEIVKDEKSVVLIHDGVRPLINSELLTRNIESVKKHGSAITVTAVKETIVVTGKDNLVKQVTTRDMSRTAKAPQSFWLDDILKEHNKALLEGKDSFIDSCALMHYYGHDLYTVEGPYENIKITTPDDFFTMRAILDARENNQIYGME